MWTPAESQRILSMAKKVRPDIRTLVLPYNLMVEKGEDAVEAYVRSHLQQAIIGDAV